MNNKTEKASVLCIIPARGGSKGVVRKNVKNLNGKPLICWTIEEAKKSRYVDRIIVSTDDEEISSISKNSGAEIIPRPAEIASDNSPIMDTILHSVRILEESGYYPDYIMLLQCTSPLRRTEHIDEAIEKLVSCKDEADSLVSVVKIEHPPWWYKTIDDAGYMHDFMDYDRIKLSRRQDFPPVYNTNGAIYIAKTEVLKQIKDFELGRPLAYIMDRISSIDIDEEMDFLVAELMMKYRNG